MNIGLVARRGVGRVLRYWPYGYRWAKDAYRRRSGDAATSQEQHQVSLDEYLEMYQNNDPKLSNPFSYYKDIVDGLLETDRVKLVPLYELQTADADRCRVVGLRHDIDNNPMVALRMARYLARVGVCGSFYLLHTALYFISSPMQEQAIRELVLGFIVAGCELGLHTDPYQLYARGLDGAAHVKVKLEWLRAQGVVVRGTVGHNSAPTYGCENFEVFREHVMWDRKMPWPLGVLSEKKLGLEYEGNFPKRKRNIDVKRAVVFTQSLKDAGVRDEKWMRTYLMDNPLYDRELDCQFWLIGRDKWAVGGTDTWGWEVGLDRVLELVRRLPEGSRSVVVVHPDYFTA